MNNFYSVKRNTANFPSNAKLVDLLWFQHLIWLDLITTYFHCLLLMK